MTIWRGTEGNVGSREIRTDVQVRRTTHVNDTDDLAFEMRRPEWWGQQNCHPSILGRDAWNRGDRSEARRIAINVMHPEHSEGVEIAKRVCKGCPVIGSCLEEALTERASIGVRGGLSEKQRKAIRRRIAKAQEVAA